MQEIEAEVITEEMFRDVVRKTLGDQFTEFDFVTGPGRSGAMASVYVSHMTGLPFLPHKANIEYSGKKILIVDTVFCSGKTINRAMNWYSRQGASAMAITFFKVSHKIPLWYEVK